MFLGTTSLHRAFWSLALSFLIGTSAQAAIYNGTFDPSSNGVTPAFNGFAIFSINDAPGCNSLGLHYYNDCNSTVSSATVYLYDNLPGSPSGPPPSPYDTLSLAPGVNIVLDYAMDAYGQLVGVDTYPMLLTAPTSAKYSGNTFYLQFYTSQPLLPFIECGDECYFDFLSSPGDPAVIYQNSFANISDPANVVFCPGTDPCRQLPFGIPEPGTLSLAAGALVSSLWLNRRRRRADSEAASEE